MFSDAAKGFSREKGGMATDVDERTHRFQSQHRGLSRPC